MSKSKFALPSGAQVITAALVLGTAIGLYGCGGGNTQADPSVPYTDAPLPKVTCSNGKTQVAVLLGLTELQARAQYCPQPTVLSATPADGATGVAVDTTVKVALDSAIDATSVVTSVTVGGNPVTVNPTLSDPKSVKVALAAALPPGKAVVYSVTGKDTDGLSFAANGTFTTDVGWWAKAVITPMGVKVVGTNRLPTGCTKWADKCAHDLVASGAIKIVASGLMIGGRHVAFAYFQNNTVSGAYDGFYETLAVYQDTGDLVGGDIGGGGGVVIDWVAGSSTGLVVHNGVTNSCYMDVFDTPSGQFTAGASDCSLGT